MNFECRLEQRCSIDIKGGVTESIFPTVEKVLAETDYQKALEFVAGKKDMCRYKSMIDFVFCEIWIEYRHRCFAFYDDAKKPRLKEILSEDERARYEHWMVAALDLAKSKMEARRRESWTSFRIEVRRLAA